MHLETSRTYYFKKKWRINITGGLIFHTFLMILSESDPSHLQQGIHQKFGCTLAHKRWIAFRRCSMCHGEMRTATFMDIWAWHFTFPGAGYQIMSGSFNQNYNGNVEFLITKTVGSVGLSVFGSLSGIFGGPRFDVMSCGDCHAIIPCIMYQYLGATKLCHLKLSFGTIYVDELPPKRRLQ